jgi:hypothetical protein
VVMKSSVFWDITPRSPEETARSYFSPLHAGFLLGILFNTEDGDDMFLRNVA